MPNSIEDLSLLDIKINTNCNQACTHCAMMEYTTSADPDKRKIVTPLSELKTIILSAGIKRAYVITGGEPTVHPEFIEILRFISHISPEARIAIQTNGIKLAKDDFVQEVLSVSPNITWVISIHGFEATHNKIVGVKSYQKVLAGLTNLKRFAPNINATSRIETVINSTNYKEIPEFVHFVHNILGYTRIGLSYARINARYDKEFLQSVVPSFKELLPVLTSLALLTKNYPTLEIITEDIPICLFEQTKRNYSHIRNTDVSHYYDTEDITVSYMGERTYTNYSDHWMGGHEHVPMCAECCMQAKCPGLWKYVIKSQDLDWLNPVLFPRYAIGN